MISLVETNEHGVRREMTFENKREAAAMLREMFGADALKTEQDHVRDETNAALRAAWRAREVDTSAFFRHGDNSNG